jgi:hypothetical protein
LEFKLEGSDIRVQDISGVDMIKSRDLMNIIGEKKVAEGDIVAPTETNLLTRNTPHTTFIAGVVANGRLLREAARAG